MKNDSAEFPYGTVHPGRWTGDYSLLEEQQGSTWMMLVIHLNCDFLEATFILWLFSLVVLQAQYRGWKLSGSESGFGYGPVEESSSRVGDVSPDFLLSLYSHSAFRWETLRNMYPGWSEIIESGWVVSNFLLLCSGVTWRQITSWAHGGRGPVYCLVKQFTWVLDSNRLDLMIPTAQEVMSTKPWEAGGCETSVFAFAVDDLHHLPPLPTSLWILPFSWETSTSREAKTLDVEAQQILLGQSWLSSSCHQIPSRDSLLPGLVQYMLKLFQLYFNTVPFILIVPWLWLKAPKTTAEVWLLNNSFFFPNSRLQTIV